VLLRALFTRADIYYSRDVWAILALSLFKPRQSLAYEAHSLAKGRLGRFLQGHAVRRAGAVITVTGRLRDDLIARSGAEARRFKVAHDGIRAERFAGVPNQATARAALGWPAGAFIVGYVGRLQTMGMDKGVGLLVEALKTVPKVTLALVGGPDDAAESFRQAWLAAGLPDAGFINAGQVPPERVPLYLSALDVCAMPFPWTEHFAYYASPMKLFEYMASGRAIIASDLPSTVEVVREGESALLYPPGDAAALAAGISRLYTDVHLREQLAARALELVQTHYTWAARAQSILAHISAVQA
jgi:glycosyltransferase involved in cell wall biosynthesis